MSVHTTSRVVVAIAALLITLAAGIMWAVQSRSTSPAPAAPRAALTTVSTKATAGQVTDARRTLPTLVVAPDTDPPGYDKEARFGRWNYIGGGCDERDAVLAHDLTDDAYAPGSSCEVVSGELYGQSVRATDLDVDHVVPERLAWSTGAAAWTDAQREAFANDLMELRAEPVSSNRANGELGPEAADPGGDRCAYAVQFVLVADRYHLTVTGPRRAALSRLLDSCPA